MRMKTSQRVNRQALILVVTKEKVKKARTLIVMLVEKVKSQKDPVRVILRATFLKVIQF